MHTAGQAFGSRLSNERVSPPTPQLRFLLVFNVYNTVDSVNIYGRGRALTPSGRFVPLGSSQNSVISSNKASEADIKQYGAYLRYTSILCVRKHLVFFCMRNITCTEWKSSRISRTLMNLFLCYDLHSV